MQFYGKGITNFTGNGITITPTSSKVSCGGINEMEKLEATFSLTSRNVEYIEETGVVKFKGLLKTDQLYRIIEKDKDDWNCSIVAVPLIYAEKTIAKDSTNEDITQVRCVDMPGTQALPKILNGTKYTGHSDITDLGTLYLDMENLSSAINGSDDNTFVKRWNGEIFVDNFDIYVNKRIGTDKGYRITYGKNLKEIKESIKMESVVTRLIPYNSQNIKLGGNTPWVDSPHIDAYDDIYEERVLFDKLKLKKEDETYSDDDIVFDTLAELRAEMVKRCKALFDAGLDKPEITLNIAMVDLSKTQEYKLMGYDVLEKLVHGDTVYCKHNKLGIETTARMVGYVFNTITEEFEDLTIGCVEYDFFKEQQGLGGKIDNVNDRVNGVVDGNGNLIAAKVKGEMNAMNTSLRYQRNIASQSHVRAEMYEDNVVDSPSYGMTAIGSAGIEISDTKDQYGEWIPQTCITPKGVICDTLYGNYIVSKNGVTYLNMITGELSVLQDNGGTMQLWQKGLRYKGSGASGWARYYITDNYFNDSVKTNSEGYFKITRNIGKYSTDLTGSIPCHASICSKQATGYMGYVMSFEQINANYNASTGILEIEGFCQAYGINSFVDNKVGVTLNTVPMTINVAVTLTL